MKKYIILIVAICILGLPGCKSWMDINKNPNEADVTALTEKLLLPLAQFEMLMLNINSTNAMSLSQHLTKSGEYSGNYTFLSGNIMPQNVDDWWERYYRNIVNLKLMQKKANEGSKETYQGIAQTLMVINYQRLVDIWGNVPYSQDCNPDKYSQPEYDDAATIYADLISKMDEAIAHFDTAIAKNEQIAELPTADIMCFGDLSLWRRLAYTVKLRLLMRISNVQDVSTQVAAIADKCLDIYENIEANPGYYAETNKMNIFYEKYGWDKNGGENTNYNQYMPTSILVDMLKVNNDPRLRVYVDPRAVLGNADDEFSNYAKFGLENDPYIGIPYGQMNPSRKSYTCTTGTGVLAGSSDKNGGRLRSSTFIAGAEVGFFLAEAALRGMIPGGEAKAKEYYQAAVISAMKRHEKAMQDNNYGIENMKPPITGSAEEAARDFLSQNNDFVNWDKMTSNDRKLEAICSQKWLSYFGYNPMEAWFEYRRNDLPKLKASNQGQQSKIICHMPYPQTERNLNAANVAKQPEVDVYNSLIFWDKKNDIVERTELYL